MNYSSKAGLFLYDSATIWLKIKGEWNMRINCLGSPGAAGFTRNIINTGSKIKAQSLLIIANTQNRRRVGGGEWDGLGVNFYLCVTSSESIPIHPRMFISLGAWRKRCWFSFVHVGMFPQTDSSSLYFIIFFFWFRNSAHKIFLIPSRACAASEAVKQFCGSSSVTYFWL